MKADVLEVIVGEQLSSVEFIQDYVQLHFDGPSLIIYQYPVLEVGGVCYDRARPGYRDVLCDRIAVLVRAATVVNGDMIVLVFEDDARLSVPLREEERDEPEAAMFQDPDSGKWAVW